MGRNGSVECKCFGGADVSLSCGLVAGVFVAPNGMCNIHD